MKCLQAWHHLQVPVLLRFRSFPLTPPYQSSASLNRVTQAIDAVHAYREQQLTSRGNPGFTQIREGEQLETQPVPTGSLRAESLAHDNEGT